MVTIDEAFEVVVSFLDDIMAKSPNRQLADVINYLQEVSENLDAYDVD